MTDRRKTELILVTGATGNVGSELVRVLVDADEDVRALCRDPAQAALPPRAERASGDLNEPESLRPALADVTAAFLLPGYRDMAGLLAELRRAGARKVVLLSSRSADGGETTNAISRYMMLSEEAVRASGIAWAILRPAGFMSNTLQWVPQLLSGDVVRAPFAGVPIAMIDPLDIATVAAVALTTGSHDGAHYALSGPQALLPAERVEILGGVLGRPLRFQAQPDDEARAEMARTTPPEYVDAFFRFYADGTLDESAVLPTVEQLTGRPPRRFQQWARAHADTFS
jgi:uncharacterized protein YbjT (DUF2867 family)